jgi:hypothetical protein
VHAIVKKHRISILQGSQLARSGDVAASWKTLFDELTRFITARGVQVLSRKMDVEKPGEFDGPTITINPKHDLEAASYYLVHSFGSICQWSTDFARAQKVFDEVRDAKAEGGSRFETALAAWRLFEQTSSDHAVWVLQEIGHAGAVASYTAFFRADIEAMTIFHRTGKEPRWPDFFADWKARVERQEIRVEPFSPKPVPPFRPVRIAKQEVLQERD